MIEFKMVDVITKAISTVVDLRDRKMKSDEKVLKELLEPLFQDLTVIVDNYFKIFFEAKLRLEQRDKGSLDAIKVLRQEHLMLRKKTLELVKVIGEESRHDLVLSFVKKVEAFFYSPGPRPELQKMKSRATTLVDFLEDGEILDSSRDELMEWVDGTLANMENNWSAICQSYSRLRIQLIKSSIKDNFKQVI